MAEGDTFIWHELVTPDQETSGNFFSELLGWDRREVDAGPRGTYTIFHLNGKDVAGMMNPTIDYTRERPAQWFAYVAVADIDGCAARVGQLGGTLIEGPTEIPGVGRVCMLADPTGGGAIRLMQPQ
jgi:predicted enzyme related to lactoylglutathione lyase